MLVGVHNSEGSKTDHFKIESPGMCKRDGETNTERIEETEKLA